MRAEHHQASVGRRWRAWLELLRPANVATAAADVLAGATVAGLTWPFPGLAPLLLAGLCLYAGGIVLNDFFDHHLDAHERPERPLPSGRVQPALAATAGLACLAAGVLAAAASSTSSALVALATAAAVLLYDAVTKKHPLAGPFTMGLCRALNLLLGISIVPDALSGAWPLGLLPLVYIAAVTMVSRGEVHGGRKPVIAAAIVMLVIVIASLAALGGATPNPSWPLLLLAWLSWRVLPAFVGAYRRPEPVQIRSAVRTGVLSLVLLNAVIAASYAGIIESLAILLTGVLAWTLARIFAVT
jgi:hypothetical protein